MNAIPVLYFQLNLNYSEAMVLDRVLCIALRVITAEVRRHGEDFSDDIDVIQGARDQIANALSSFHSSPPRHLSFTVLKLSALEAHCFFRALEGRVFKRIAGKTGMPVSYMVTGDAHQVLSGLVSRYLSFRKLAISMKDKLYPLQPDPRGNSILDEARQKILAQIETEESLRIKEEIKRWNLEWEMPPDEDPEPTEDAEPEEEYYDFVPV